MNKIEYDITFFIAKNENSEFCYGLLELKEELKDHFSHLSKDYLKLKYQSSINMSSFRKTEFFWSSKWKFIGITEFDKIEQFKKAILSLPDIDLNYDINCCKKEYIILQERK